LSDRYNPAHLAHEVIDAAVKAGKEARRALRYARTPADLIPFEAPGRFGKCTCGSINLKVDRHVTLYCVDCGRDLQRYD